MADITKCTNQSCPLKDRCYRQLAPSGEYQYYARFEYDRGCEYFWGVKKRCKVCKMEGEFYKNGNYEDAVCKPCKIKRVLRGRKRRESASEEA